MEGYNGKNGWAFGDIAGESHRTDIDADSICQLLEDEIIPLYYAMSDDGSPKGRVRVMKETIRSNAARFSARRMVKEYAQRYYVNVNATKKIRETDVKKIEIKTG